jgi:hypothetical protein
LAVLSSGSHRCVKLKYSFFFLPCVSYLRKILAAVDPNLSAQKIAEALVKMCLENRELCRKYVYGHAVT